ncbi:MAG: transcriptional regulator [Candidatus Saccharimonas sp.]
MIDALFGSKTRVKLLYLFMSNPGKAFYVREITRLIDEQINSVRRELANMLAVGVITSSSTDNKLYYEVNQRYEFFSAFREIFAGTKSKAPKKISGRDGAESLGWRDAFAGVNGVRVAIASGVLVEGSVSKVDLLVVGDVVRKKLDAAVKLVEGAVGRDVNFSIMRYDEFYYRLSIRDRFVNEILSNKHVILVDKDNVVSS